MFCCELIANNTRFYEKKRIKWNHVLFPFFRFDVHSTCTRRKAKKYIGFGRKVERIKGDLIRVFISFRFNAVFVKFVDDSKEWESRRWKEVICGRASISHSGARWCRWSSSIKTHIGENKKKKKMGRKKSIKFGIEFICNFTRWRWWFRWDLQHVICTEVKWTTAYSFRSNCLQLITASIQLQTHKGEMENMVKKEAVRVAVMLIDQTMHSPKKNTSAVKMSNERVEQAMWWNWKFYNIHKGAFRANNETKAANSREQHLTISVSVYVRVLLFYWLSCWYVLLF